MPYSVPVFGGAKLFGGNDWVFWGGRLRAEAGNEVEGTVAGEEEWRRISGGFWGEWDGDILCVSLTKPSFIWANPIMCNFQTLSTPLSSAVAFLLSPSLAITATFSLSWDLQMHVVRWVQDTKTDGSFFYNQCTRAASALRSISLLCLQHCSGGLHLPPSSPSISDCPQSWQGQNTQWVLFCRWLGCLDCSGQWSLCFHFK